MSKDTPVNYFLKTYICTYYSIFFISWSLSVVHTGLGFSLWYCVPGMCLSWETFCRNVLHTWAAGPAVEGRSSGCWHGRTCDRRAEPGPVPRRPTGSHSAAAWRSPRTAQSVNTHTHTHLAQDTRFGPGAFVCLTVFESLQRFFHSCQQRWKQNNLQRQALLSLLVWNTLNAAFCTLSGKLKQSRGAAYIISPVQERVVLRKSIMSCKHYLFMF